MDHGTNLKSTYHRDAVSRHRAFCLRHSDGGGLAAGIILLAWIAFGSIILLGSFGVIDARIGDLWPVVLILAGANMLLCGGRYRMESHGDRTEEPPTAYSKRSEQ